MGIFKVQAWAIGTKHLRVSSFWRMFLHVSPPKVPKNHVNRSSNLHDSCNDLASRFQKNSRLFHQFYVQVGVRVWPFFWFEEPNKAPKNQRKLVTFSGFKQKDFMSFNFLCFNSPVLPLLWVFWKWPYLIWAKLGWLIHQPKFSSMAIFWVVQRIVSPRFAKTLLQRLYRSKPAGYLSDSSTYLCSACFFWIFGTQNHSETIALLLCRTT